MQMKTEVFNIEENVNLIGNETIKVVYKSATFKKEIDPTEDVQGYIDVVYSFAGLDLNLTIEIYTKINDEGDIDRTFKLPFCEEQISVVELYHEKGYQEYLEECSPVKVTLS